MRRNLITKLGGNHGVDTMIMEKKVGEANDEFEINCLGYGFRYVISQQKKLVFH